MEVNKYRSNFEDTLTVLNKIKIHSDPKDLVSFYNTEFSQTQTQTTQ